MEQPKIELPPKIKQQISTINEQTQTFVSNQERRIMDIIQATCFIKEIDLPNEIKLDENLDILISI